MSDKAIGLYRKYDVRRVDGSSEPGEKHEECEYFVLDLNHDPYSMPALHAYAEACRSAYPSLASDIRLKLKVLGFRFAPPETTEEE